MYSRLYEEGMRLTHYKGILLSIVFMMVFSTVAPALVFAASVFHANKRLSTTITAINTVTTGGMPEGRAGTRGVNGLDGKDGVSAAQAGISVLQTEGAVARIQVTNTDGLVSVQSTGVTAEGIASDQKVSSSAFATTSVSATKEVSSSANGTSVTEMQRLERLPMFLHALSSIRLMLASYVGISL